MGRDCLDRRLEIARLDDLDAILQAPENVRQAGAKKSVVIDDENSLVVPED